MVSAAVEIWWETTAGGLARLESTRNNLGGPGGEEPMHK